MAAIMGEAGDWWNVQGEWVETPNHDRAGLSGVQRWAAADGACYYIKRQRDYLFRSLRFPMGRPTLLREFNNIVRCARTGVPTAEPVFFDLRQRDHHWEALLVTRSLDDSHISLQEGLRTQRWADSRRAQVLDAVVAVVMRMHRLRRKHGHLYPKEIFVDNRHAEPRIVFIDLELSRRCLTAKHAAISDLKRFFRKAIGLGVSGIECRRVLGHYDKAGIALPAGLARQWTDAADAHPSP